MRVFPLLIVIALFIANIKSDDYYLSEEEDQQTNQADTSGDFIRQFTCYVGIQRFFSAAQEKNRFVAHQSKPTYALKLKQIKARMFLKGLKDMPQSSVDAVQKAASAADFELIDFTSVEIDNIDELFDEPDAKLSTEEKNGWKGLYSVEQQVKEMQKKNKRDNPNNQNDDDEETWESVRKSKAPPSIAGVDLSNNVLRYIVFGGIIVLVLGVYKMASTLFEDDSKNKKKKEKNK